MGSIDWRGMSCAKEMGCKTLSHTVSRDADIQHTRVHTARKHGRKNKNREKQECWLFSEVSLLFQLSSMKEITVWGNLHKHASLLPPPLFMINEIRVASTHWFKDVIADNCSSLPELEAALFDLCSCKGLLKVMKLAGCGECTSGAVKMRTPTNKRKCWKMRGEENYYLSSWN